jgi:hypothetical protein
MNQEHKLDEILKYYKDTYSVVEPIEDIKRDLLKNNVEVRGDSFYCPVWSDVLECWLLLAGTKDAADLWVLKKIIRLIKTGVPIITMFNGNSKYLISQFERYDLEVLCFEGDMAMIKFNGEK